MKAVHVFAVFALAVWGCGTAERALAQAQTPAPKALVASTNANTLSASTQSTVSVPLRESATVSLRLTEPTDTNSFHYTLSKSTQLRVTGPVVQSLKAKNPEDFSRRVLHLVSPFAKEQPSWQTASTGPVNTRAWSTIVGWNPGDTAFPDETHHEPPHLDLISINVEKQPRDRSE